MYSDIVLWVGLPGSGKSHYATKFCDMVVDDITDLSQLPAPDSLEGKRLGITDVNFCDPKVLSAALTKLKEIYPSAVISISYFENDVDKCRANVVYRNDNRVVDGTIRRFSSVYKPPSPAIPIWSIEDEAQD